MSENNPANGGQSILDRMSELMRAVTADRDQLLRACAATDAELASAAANATNRQRLPYSTLTCIQLALQPARSAVDASRVSGAIGLPPKVEGRPANPTAYFFQRARERIRAVTADRDQLLHACESIEAELTAAFAKITIGQPLPYSTLTSIQLALTTARSAIDASRTAGAH